MGGIKKSDKTIMLKNWEWRQTRVFLDPLKRNVGKAIEPLLGWGPSSRITIRCHCTVDARIRGAQFPYQQIQLEHVLESSR